MVRFDPLIEHIGNQPGVTRIELVDSRDHLGVQLADLLCGFIRTAFTRITAEEVLNADEQAMCADLFMLKQEFEVWNGNLPESTWMSFVELSVNELQRRSRSRTEPQTS